MQLYRHDPFTAVMRLPGYAPGYAIMLVHLSLCKLRDFPFPFSLLGDATNNGCYDKTFHRRSA